MAFFRVKSDKEAMRLTHGKVTKKELTQARYKARKRGKPPEQAPKYWQHYLYELLKVHVRVDSAWEFEPFLPRKYHADIAYPAHKLAVEVDEWHAHRRLHQMNADRAKDIWFMQHGWTVLRFTDNQVKQSPMRCVQTVQWFLTHLEWEETL